MKSAMLFFLVYVLVISCCLGQQNPVKHSKILFLNSATSTWPIKLTKQRFEGDTAYTLTFKNAKSKSFKTSEQGFFKSELKSFGRALQMALTIDSSSAVKFSEGEITIITGETSKKQIECSFSNGTGVFRANESDVKNIIIAIRKRIIIEFYASKIST